MAKNKQRARFTSQKSLTAVNQYHGGGQTFSTDGQIENFVSTGGRVYYTHGSQTVRRDALVGRFNFQRASHKRIFSGV